VKFTIVNNKSQQKSKNSQKIIFGKERKTPTHGKQFGAACVISIASRGWVSAANPKASENPKKEAERGNYKAS